LKTFNEWNRYPFYFSQLYSVNLIFIVSHNYFLRVIQKKAIVKMRFVVNCPSHKTWLVSLNTFYARDCVCTRANSREKEKISIATQRICCEWWVRKEANARGRMRMRNTRNFLSILLTLFVGALRDITCLRRYFFAIT